MLTNLLILLDVGNFEHIILCSLSGYIMSVFSKLQRGSFNPHPPVAGIKEKPGLNRAIGRSLFI